MRRTHVAALLLLAVALAASAAGALPLARRQAPSPADRVKTVRREEWGVLVC